VAVATKILEWHCYVAACGDIVAHAGVLLLTITLPCQAKVHLGRFAFAFVLMWTFVSDQCDIILDAFQGSFGCQAMHGTIVKVSPCL
jgi:hypothetical protein